MIIARPLVVGVDEIWRPQPPTAWGSPAAGFPQALARTVGPQRSWLAALTHRSVLHWALGLPFDAASLDRKPQCSACRQYSPVLSMLLSRGANSTACGRAGGEQWPTPEADPGPSVATATIAAPAAVSSSSQEGRPSPAADTPLDVSSLLLVRPPHEQQEADTNAQGSSSSGLRRHKRTSRSSQDVTLRPVVKIRRQESEWSLVSFSSLRTDESVELSEKAELSSDDDVGRRGKERCT
jgi:hypothetical protein